MHSWPCSKSGRTWNHSKTLPLALQALKEGRARARAAHLVARTQAFHQARAAAVLVSQEERLQQDQQQREQAAAAHPHRAPLPTFSPTAKAVPHDTICTTSLSTTHSSTPGSQWPDAQVAMECHPDWGVRALTDAQPESLQKQQLRQQLSGVSETILGKRLCLGESTVSGQRVNRSLAQLQVHNEQRINKTDLCTILTACGEKGPCYNVRTVLPYQTESLLAAKLRLIRLVNGETGQVLKERQQHLPPQSQQQQQQQ